MTRAIRRGILAALVFATGCAGVSSTTTFGAASGEPSEMTETKPTRALTKEEYKKLMEERAQEAEEVQAWVGG